MRTRWSRAYIVHKGRKIYLDNTLWELKEKMATRDDKVSLNVSKLFSNKEKTFMKSNITYYGRV